MRPAESFVEQPVRSLQTMLRVLALDDGRIPQVVPDGIYGPQTMYAVSAFQRLQGLPVTGVTDGRTWQALTQAYEQALVRVEQAQPLTVLMEPGAVYGEADTGPYVFILQAMPSYLSQVHPVLPVPGSGGVMDGDTVGTLRAFQELCGLPASGQLDRLTWKHAVLQFTLCAHHRQNGTKPESAE